MLKCHVVVCCRMTPIQKAQLVELIRIATNDVVIAVGDGANDVAMIQVIISFYMVNINFFYPT